MTFSAIFRKIFIAHARFNDCDVILLPDWNSIADSESAISTCY